MSKKSASEAVSRHRLFGSSPVLEGEDAAAYDELFGRICAAVKPADVIEEILIADVAALEWEVLRWHRLKTILIRECGRRALRGFLSNRLDYHLYQKHFVDDLTRILQDNSAEDQPEDVAQTLARDCARNEPEAVDKVNAFLSDIGQHMDNILDGARDQKAEELVQDYAQGQPRAVKLINKLLAEVGTSIDDLMVGKLRDDLDLVERIDRLATVAESRRNASLREIDRRRVVLGEAVRRSVQEIEEGEFKVIETKPTEGEDAA